MLPLRSFIYTNLKKKEGIFSIQLHRKVMKVSFSPGCRFNDAALRMIQDPFAGLRPLCQSILNNVPAVSLQTPPWLHRPQPLLSSWLQPWSKGGVRSHGRPPASSNGQWMFLGPFQALKGASASAQLHGRRLSLSLVNYQPAPTFTVMHTQVAR